MKESIGSTLMLYVFLVLFVVIMSIMAVAINFALTFQKKNQIITILEQCDGEYGKCQKKLEEKGCVKVTNISDKYSYTKKHICEIAEKTAKGTNTKGTYYQIVVFVEFDFPFVDKAIYFPINGETSVVSVENTTTSKKPTIKYDKK